MKQNPKIYDLAEKHAKRRAEQRDWPSIEEQKQYWIDKEAQSDNATFETCPACGLNQKSAEAAAIWKHRSNPSKNKCVSCSIDLASSINKPDSVTADHKPKTDDLSRTEATCDWYDHCDNDVSLNWRLRDEGRSDGQGESYASRNL